MGCIPSREKVGCFPSALGGHLDGREAVRCTNRKDIWLLPAADIFWCYTSNTLSDGSNLNSSDAARYPMARLRLKRSERGRGLATELRRLSPDRARRCVARDVAFFLAREMKTCLLRTTRVVDAKVHPSRCVGMHLWRMPPMPQTTSIQRRYSFSNNTPG